MWGKGLAVGWGGGEEAEFFGLSCFCIFHLIRVLRGRDGVGEELTPVLCSLPQGKQLP